MRISDWSSDVCSSDLPEGGRRQTNVAVHEHHQIVRTRLAAHDRPQYLRHGAALAVATLVHVADLDSLRVAVVIQQLVQHVDVGAVADCREHRRRRSEEHTSELQSLMRNSYAVFCL